MVIGIVLIALSVLVLSQVIGWLASRENMALAAWLTSFLLGVVILVIVWMVGLRPYRASFSSLGLRLPQIPTVKWVGMTVGVLLLSLGTTSLYAVLVRQMGFDILLPPEISADIVFPGPRVVLTFLALAMWTPLTEEIFFHGFVFSGLIPKWGAPGATSFLLAWLYQRTGSLWTSVLAHAGQNAAALLATIYGI